jgi:hypothetical protein
MLRHMKPRFLRIWRCNYEKRDLRYVGLRLFFD